MIPIPLPRHPVRPLGEPPHARRAALLAFAFFLAGAVSLAVEGVHLASLQRAFPLYGLGGFGILIFGTSRLLLAGMAGRDIVGGGVGALLTVVPAAIGAVGLYAAHDATPAARSAFAAAWAWGALAHVVILTLSAWRRPTREPVADPIASPGAMLPRRLLEAGSLLYALASAAALPASAMGRVPPAAAIHLVLVGFVITTIMGVASHILPRFTRSRIPEPLLWLLAPFALAGPALVAAGLAGSPALLAVGAGVEGAAFGLFAAIVLVPLVRAHRFRPSFVGYATAPFAIAVGGLLALGFALTGRFGPQLAVHGLLNVFGFVGLFVAAAATDLYAPALRAGAPPALRHARVTFALGVAGLGVAAFGAWVGQDGLARGGIGVYAIGVAWQMVGIAASHRRAERVVTRLRVR